jgi:hypothetical protein
MGTKVTTLDVLVHTTGLFFYKIESCLGHGSPGPVCSCWAAQDCVGEVMLCEFYNWFLAFFIKWAQIALEADTHPWVREQRVKLHTQGVKTV